MTELYYDVCEKTFQFQRLQEIMYKCVLEINLHISNTLYKYCKYDCSN